MFVVCSFGMAQSKALSSTSSRLPHHHFPSATSSLSVCTTSVLAFISIFLPQRHYHSTTVTQPHIRSYSATQPQLLSHTAAVTQPHSHSPAATSPLMVVYQATSRLPSPHNKPYLHHSWHSISL